MFGVIGERLEGRRRFKSCYPLILRILVQTITASLKYWLGFSLSRMHGLPIRATINPTIH